tara:strand:+ start:133 stop:387 length:255 start_codon:yes stop_codon:yes gene_type:complete
MKRLIQNFLRGELIGSSIKSQLKNIKGRIIDETKNTFEVLTTKKQRKKILKNQKIIFKIKNKNVTVNGKLLKIRPEERIKLKLK